MNDRLQRNGSQFTPSALERELSHRRHDAFLSSVQNPHPDTAGLLDTGLGDWTADLADDERLVDVAAGTSVRWVEDHGWTKDSA